MTHLATIRAISSPALISILIPIFFSDPHFKVSIFQLLMSWLYNYLGSVHFQECIYKKQNQANLKVNYKT